MPRRRHSPIVAAAGAASLLALLLAGCDLPSTFARETGAAGAAGASPGDSVYIGVAAARSGANDAYFRGVRLAVTRLNAERPAGARPFALMLPPEQQPTQVAVAAAFRDDPRVVAVVGHTGSGQTMEAAPVYADVDGGGRRALVAVSPTATNPAVTRDGDWVFRVCPTDVDGARALARFALDSVGARRVAVIYRNDLFGRGFSRALAAELARGGAEVVERDPYLAGITDFPAYTARVARRGADALVVAGGGSDAAQIVRSLRAAAASGDAAGSRIRVLGSDDLASLNDSLATRREFAGTRFVTFYDPRRAAGAEAERFRREYLAANGAEPTHQAALSYDAAMVIGRAVLAVGADRRRVRDRIASVGAAGGAPAHAGVTGTIRFDPQGDVVAKPVFMGEVRP